MMFLFVMFAGVHCCFASRQIAPAVGQSPMVAATAVRRLGQREQLHRRTAENKWPRESAVLLKTQAAPGSGYAVRQEVVKDPDVSALLAALEFHAKEELNYELFIVPGKPVTPEMLKIMGRGLEHLYEALRDLHRPLSEEDKKRVNDRLEKTMGPIPVRLLPDLIRSANYEGSPLLLTFFVGRYTKYLDGLKKNSTAAKNLVIEELRRQNFPREILELIARYDFLLDGPGLDKEVGALLGPVRRGEKDEKTRLTVPAVATTAAKPLAEPAQAVAAQKYFAKIPFAVIQAWRPFKPRLLARFPHLESNPNEVRSIGGDEYRRETALAYAFPGANPMRDVASLVRLPGLDINFLFKPGVQYSYSIRAISYVIDEPKLLQILLDAGADVEAAVDEEGMTPMQRAIDDLSHEHGSERGNRLDRSVELLLDAGAKFSQDLILKGWHELRYVPAGVRTWLRARGLMPDDKK